MRKLVVILIAIAFVPFISMASNDGKPVKSNNVTKEVKLNVADDDWTPVGTTEIIKMNGRIVDATQTVQVYRNSEGTRAIKDGKRYSEIIENNRYGFAPADQCIECGYRYRVFYQMDYWYTHSIVKRTYGSY